MRREDLLELLRQQPFMPFRLHLSDGTRFEIRHPDMAIVGRSTMAVSLTPDATGERQAIIALLHVMWIEVVVPAM